jgi:hypothetical protein
LEIVPVILWFALILVRLPFGIRLYNREYGTQKSILNLDKYDSLLLLFYWWSPEQKKNKKLAFLLNALLLIWLFSLIAVPIILQNKE